MTNTKAKYGIAGEKRKKLEEEKGIIVRFVIGHRLEIISSSMNNLDKHA